MYLATILMYSTLYVVAYIVLSLIHSGLGSIICCISKLYMYAQIVSHLPLVRDIV